MQHIMPHMVIAINKTVPVVIAELGKPRYLSREAVKDILVERGVNMPGHNQYFSRKVNDAIIDCGYEAWSNTGGSRKYKAYRRISEEETRIPCENQSAGSTPASGLGGGPGGPATAP